MQLHCLVADGVFEEAVNDELVAVLRTVANGRRVAEHIDLGEHGGRSEAGSCRCGTSRRTTGLG